MAKSTNYSVALIWGSTTTLMKVVAQDFAKRNVTLALYAQDDADDKLDEIQRTVEMDGGKPLVIHNGNGDPQSVISTVVDRLGRLDYAVNLFLPEPTMDPHKVMRYPDVLLTRGMVIGEAIAAHTEQGSIVNHCFLPSMYAGTPLAPYFPILKGAVTGVTRSLCIQLGRAGVRVNCVQTGLLDIPEIRAFADTKVQNMQVPVGRWSTAEEVAKLITFISVESTYMTGQSVVIDGGLTAGNTGT